MALLANAPILDDRDYAQILSEAKSLIPRYTREWTDLNDSDPGITLLQLFAWMTEMTLYRLNQVPERNYIKFLQLLGIELNPALPAAADLTFRLARKDVDTVIVPKGTQVAASADDGGGDGPVIFETDEALIALGATLAAVQSFDGYGYSVETTKNNADSQTYFPFGANVRAGNALALGFDSPLPFTKDRITLTVYLAQPVRNAESQPCDAGLDVLPAPATLVWEFWDGRRWSALSLDRDGTRAFTQSGRIQVRGPGVNARKDTIGNVPAPLYWLRCRVVDQQYERAPRVDSIIINSVGATQGVTVRDEVVGGSDGRPNQRLRLAHTPVIARARPEDATGADGKRVRITSVRLEVAESIDDFQVWQEVPDFLASGPDDPHYTLNRTTGDIAFGDGEHGRIPSANPNHAFDSIIAREYRYGGGKQGNVAAGAIKGLQTFVRNVESASNLRPAAGGSDEETVEAAKLRAPRELKSKGRAVTAEDFETLALAAPGARVLRAKAMPLAHPRFPGVPVPGVVSVIVVPDSEAPNPTPNAATIAAVCAHLNRARLLTSEVCVVPPTYHKVKIQADVVARPEADLAEVKAALEQRLTIYFHPLKGGKYGDGWEFGRHIFYSDVYRVILETPQVDRIQNNQLLMIVDDVRGEFCRDVAIEPGALPYSTGHDLTVTYGA
ncbi:MAG: putative baseplate assembly protein [Chloroflexi bacterium]|nr:putative baseplate assembly protein [Chloroflexota bacterium]